MVGFENETERLRRERTQVQESAAMARIFFLLSVATTQFQATVIQFQAIKLARAQLKRSEIHREDVIPQDERHHPQPAQERYQQD